MLPVAGDRAIRQVDAILEADPHQIAPHGQTQGHDPIHVAPSASSIRKQRESLPTLEPRALIVELVREAEAASRIVFRRRALGGGRAVTQLRLKLQILRQIDIDVRLARASRACFDSHIDAVGDIASNFEARSD